MIIHYNSEIIHYSAEVIHYFILFIIDYINDLIAI